MADFAFGSGLSDVDLSGITSGSDQAVLPDVSYGGPAEQPTTPAGNGLGDYLFGTLDKALNYALQRDAQQMSYQQQAPVMAQNTQLAQLQLQRQKMSNQTLFMLLLGAGVLFFATRKA